ncbi:N-myristoyl transferase [Hesseltinella vesiculosa]|uniref:Glycylpeptide N-tetradecanoyltransferase n=1 Tax=Hesseltinella vesiculosa TaxID=101127 RepID=A0A1X2GXK9_9FUNG|nr:N-myristoyl transferase [Hesseltinella vesiculosa]
MPKDKQSQMPSLQDLLAGRGDMDEESRRKLEALLRTLSLQEDDSKNKKDMESHRFWRTQPVLKYDEVSDEIGAIEPSVPVDQVKQTPESLPNDFEWCELDMRDEQDAKELYDFLTKNYVEDDGGQFRFDYSFEFLRWALQPPGWRKDWLVGVRVTSTRRLVAFISAIPVHLRTMDKVTLMTEINFLNVHKRLRSKRLAPVMIREITRRSHLQGIFQAVYTAGAVLPKPVSTCQYFHRSLNPKKLVECGFSRVPHNSTMARMIKNYKVPEKPALEGFRVMEAKDVPEVRALLNKFLARYQFAPEFESDEEIVHWILPHEKVVWSYVVEDPTTHKITDMVSFYSLPSTVIGNPKHSTLNAAYLFYYATDKGLPEQKGGELDEQAQATFGNRLNEVMADALVMARKQDFDVFNALHLMDNHTFLSTQKFGSGDGFLNFYVYNWRCPEVQQEKIGLVML